MPYFGYDSDSSSNDLYWVDISVIECLRCCRIFKNEAAKEQHIRASNSHHICVMCNEDIRSRHLLQQHYRSDHFWCEEGGCHRIYDSQWGFNQHLIDFNVCSICDAHFENQNNLRAHKLVHLPKNLQCYARGCERMFATESAMLIHLESGTCESNVDAATLHNIASRCFQWKKYTVPGYRYEMLFSQDPHVRMTCYRCPDVNCGVHFDTLSGLVQHVESDRCDEGIDAGTGSIRKLLRWIYKRT